MGNETITIERAANGWIVRDGISEETRVIANENEIEAMVELLWDLVEFHGPPSGRHDAERIRVITVPGDKWADSNPDAANCKHNWVAREPAFADYPEGWSCPCGQGFAPVPKGEGEG